MSASGAYPWLRVILGPVVDVIRALAHLLPDKVHARLAELADAPDSKSGTREGVGVRFPRRAPPSCGSPGGRSSLTVVSFSPDTRQLLSCRVGRCTLLPR